MLDVDLNGAWRCFRAALPHMRRAGYGRLLATSSIAGTVQAWPAHPHYTAAKAGLVGLIKTLAVEYGPDGITANAVAPGVIETPQANDPVNSLGPDGVAGGRAEGSVGPGRRPGGHRLPVPVPGQRAGVLRERSAHRRRRRALPRRAGLAVSVLPASGVISLARGVPAPDLFPVTELGEASRRAFARHSATALNYGPPGGFGPLQEWLAAGTAPRRTRS